MSNTESQPQLSMEDAGVSIEKSIEEIGSSVAKIEFYIESYRDSPTSICLRDSLPADWPEDQIGFHPERNIEDWSVEDGAVVLERSLAPGQQVTELYAAKLDETHDLEQFHTMPSISIDDEIMAGGDLPAGTDSDEPSEDMAFESISLEDEPGDDVDQPGSSNGPVADPISPDEATAVGDDFTRGGSAENTEAGEDDAFDAFALGEFSELVDASVEEKQPERPSSLDDIDLADEVAHEDSTPEEDGTGDAVEESSDADRASTPSQVTPSQDESMNAPDSVSPAFIKSLIETIDSDLDADERDQLRDALGIQPASSLSARVDHLQSEINELLAYKKALRQFIDEEGGAAAVLESVRQEQAALHERTDAVEGKLEELSQLPTELETTRHELADLEDSVEDRVDELDTSLKETNATVSDLDQWRDDHLESLDKRLASLEDALSGSIDEVGERVHTVEQDLTSLEDAHSDRLVDLESWLAQHEADTTDRFEDVSDRVNSVEKELHDSFDALSDRLTDEYEYAIELIESLRRDIDATVAERETAIESLDERIDALGDELEAEFATLQQQLEEIETELPARIDRQADRLDALDDRHTDDVDALEGELADLEESLRTSAAAIDDLRSWQDRLRDTFDHLASGPAEATSSDEADEPDTAVADGGNTEQS